MEEEPVEEGEACHNVGLESDVGRGPVSGSWLAWLGEVGWEGLLGWRGFALYIAKSSRRMLSDQVQKLRFCPNFLV